MKIELEICLEPNDEYYLDFDNVTDVLRSEVCSTTNINFELLEDNTIYGITADFNTSAVPYSHSKQDSARDYFIRYAVTRFLALILCEIKVNPFHYEVMQGLYSMFTRAMDDIVNTSGGTICLSLSDQSNSMIIINVVK